MCILVRLFFIIIYVEDLNAFKAYDRKVPNAVVFSDLRSRQVELHRWGKANRVTFDVGKSHFCVNVRETLVWSSLLLNCYLDRYHYLLRFRYYELKR